MDRYAPRARSDAYGRRINREHSPFVALALPWASIMLGSLLPMFFIATALPHTRLLKLPACGHAPHQDQPAAVQQAITDLLADLP